MTASEFSTCCVELRWQRQTMVYDLTFMLTGPCDSRSRRVDVLSGERRTPTRIEMVVYRMRKILYLSRRFCSQELSTATCTALPLRCFLCVFLLLIIPSASIQQTERYKAHASLTGRRDALISRFFLWAWIKVRCSVEQQSPFDFLLLCFCNMNTI